VKTEIVAAIYDRRRNRRPAATERAVELFKKGEPVALPTETVTAWLRMRLIQSPLPKIFEAKERRISDPLIGSLPGSDWLDASLEVRDDKLQLIRKLADQFCQGLSPSFCQA